ncbi:hemolysin XhlA family protein [Cohnella yongneupensis]|uniref:Hemolysin XhlA family protein n=1 Tax=Cohnella yongneupensis TaxID=425006 RepID=A0ABW0QXZ8_9BACL
MGVEIEKLNEIAVKVSGMEATQRAQSDAVGKMASSVERLVEKLEKSDDIAREADQRARAAHHRIDDTNVQVREVKDDIKWLWRTIVGAIIVSGVGGAIAFLWKGIENN